VWRYFLDSGSNKVESETAKSHPCCMFDHISEDPAPIRIETELPTACGQTKAATGELPSSTNDPDERSLPQRAMPRMPSLLSVRLDQISGEHAVVTKLREELGAYFQEPVKGQMSAAGLVKLAHHYPLHVTKKGNRYSCISGLRILRLLKADLPNETEIPVLLSKRLREDVLRDIACFDLALTPVVLALHPRDKRVMGGLWQRQKDSKVFRDNLQVAGAKALSRMLGCDPRTVAERSDAVQRA
jgi:hypothetical protein